TLGAASPAAAGDRTATADGPGLRPRPWAGRRYLAGLRPGPRPIRRHHHRPRRPPALRLRRLPARDPPTRHRRAWSGDPVVPPGPGRPTPGRPQYPAVF